jgi:hypothetical protein
MAGDFRRNPQPNAVVATAKIERRYVYDYNSCHDEDEVIVNPKGLFDLSVERYVRPAKPPNRFAWNQSESP